MKPNEVAKLIEELVRAVVERPECAKISLRDMSASSILSITVRESDSRLVIGREGRMFRALESIVRLASQDTWPVALAKLPGPSGAAKVTLHGRTVKLSELEIERLLVKTMRACFHRWSEAESSANEDGIVFQIVADAPRSVAAMAEPALQTIFEAIGRTNGVRVTVVVAIREDRQPPTAGGRHAGEVPPVSNK